MNSKSTAGKPLLHIYEVKRQHGGLNQEIYLKSCLGLGPIFFESTTTEVFKTTFSEIADFRPSETLDHTHILGASLLKKFQSFKKNIEVTLILRDHLHNKFSFLAF